MPVTFHIPGPLRTFTEGASQVAVDSSPKNVAEAFTALWRKYPSVRYRILNEQGAVREHINIFVGTESIRYTGGLNTILADECEIFIIPAVSGG